MKHVPSDGVSKIEKGIKATLKVTPSKNMVDLILEDAKTTYGEGAEYSFLSSEKDGNNWKAELKISLQPHSKCPAIMKRSYTLFPIKYREEVINSRCTVGGVIIYPEEAIIASNGLQRVKDLPDTAKAYAKKYAAEEITALKLCTNNCPEEARFVKTLPEQKLWIVKWVAGDGAVFFVAIDEQGKVIA